MEINIKVVSGTSETLTLTVDSSETTTVLMLKQLIAAQHPTRFPVGGQRLIFQGQILQNDKFLSDYNITKGMALHLSVARGTEPPLTRSSDPTPQLDPASIMRGYLAQMRSLERDYATAIQTLSKICENIINHPHEEKYRKLRIGNAALKSRLLDRMHGMDCVHLMGFREGIEAVRVFIFNSIILI